MNTLSPLAGWRVQRMNGAGNKILVIDLRGSGFRPTPEQARAIHAAPGLDYDQMMVMTDPRRSDTLSYVLIYNNDGSLAGACGNGTRCVADRLAREVNKDRFAVETQAGKIVCERLGESDYRVDMGEPHLAWRDIPLAYEVLDTSRIQLALAEDAALGTASCISLGNPHAAFFVANAAAIDLARLGPRYETHPIFPEKANISFAQILGPQDIRLRVWERGVGATLACGSAACATLVSAIRLGLAERSARVALPGGDLLIAWRESDSHVTMTGPVQFEREITLSASIFSASPAA